MVLGKCMVKGCEQQAVIRAIVSSGDYAGAADLCQQHYDEAAAKYEAQKTRRKRSK